VETVETIKFQSRWAVQDVHVSTLGSSAVHRAVTSFVVKSFELAVQHGCRSSSVQVQDFVESKMNEQSE
jgi:hypothetical protein